MHLSLSYLFPTSYLLHSSFSLFKFFLTVYFLSLLFFSHFLPPQILILSTLCNLYSFRHVTNSVSLSLSSLVRRRWRGTTTWRSYRRYKRSNSTTWCIRIVSPRTLRPRALWSPALDLVSSTLVSPTVILINTVSLWWFDKEILVGAGCVLIKGYGPNLT